MTETGPQAGSSSKASTMWKPMKPHPPMTNDGPYIPGDVAEFMVSDCIIRKPARGYLARWHYINCRMNKYRYFADELLSYSGTLRLGSCRKLLLDPRTKSVGFTVSLQHLGGAALPLVPAMVRIAWVVSGRVIIRSVAGLEHLSHTSRTKIA